MPDNGQHNYTLMDYILIITQNPYIHKSKQYNSIIFYFYFFTSSYKTNLIGVL